MMVRRGWFKDLAIGSTMMWITLFVVVPYLFVLLFSFLKPDPERIIVWDFTFINYRDIFSPVFLIVCWYSLILALGTTVITLLVAYTFCLYPGPSSQRHPEDSAPAHVSSHSGPLLSYAPMH